MDKIFRHSVDEKKYTIHCIAYIYTYSYFTYISQVSTGCAIEFFYEDDSHEIRRSISRVPGFPGRCGES